MSAIAEAFFAPRERPAGSRRRSQVGSSGDAPGGLRGGLRGDRVELERLPPRQRAELGLPEPEPDVTRLLDRLRLR